MNIPSDMRPMGSSRSMLPKDYIPCSFLYFNGSCIFDTGYVPTPDSGFSFDVYLDAKDNLYHSLAGNNKRDSTANYVYVFGVLAGKVLFYINHAYYPLRDGGYANTTNLAPENNAYIAENMRVYGTLNWKNDNIFRFNLGGESLCRELPERLSEYSSQLSIGHGSCDHTLTHSFQGRLYRFAISQGVKQVRDFIPALSTTGRPCLYDQTQTSQPLMNPTSALAIPGFTLAEARKLAQLSDAGGNLTIQLPSGWETDVNVTTPLENARNKGWTITVQTHKTNGKSSTYRLRRPQTIVWCRKCASDNGSYIDSTSTRWNIEWCSAIYSPLGNNPEQYGYEPFGSIEEAAETWQLLPYTNTAENAAK